MNNTPHWDLTPLYSDFTSWSADLEALRKKSPWEEIKERPLQNATEIRALLEGYFQLQRHLDRLRTWAHLKNDEELSNPKFKEAYAQTLFLLNNLSEQSAWIEPALLTADSTLFDSPVLLPYASFLKKIVRLKPHTLSKEQEQLLALAGNALHVTYKAFSSLSDVDLTFPQLVDNQGRGHTLTNSNFSRFLQSSDPILRKNAFESLFAVFHSHKNTICELLSGQCLSHTFHAKARKYSSSLEASLFPHQIDQKVYMGLITQVRSRVDLLHRYFTLKKRLLQLDQLHCYDLYAPINRADLAVPYEKAVDLVIASVGPLGKEYQEDLQRGLQVEHWVDPFEGKGKRSGAYSSGCYDSPPYILMNYRPLLRDLFTLAHEAGHSMHSLLTHRHQEYQNSSYAIFVAEVASTLNEELLFWHLFDQLQKKEEKIFLLHARLEDIRATLFRQTLFAEFEWQIHRSIDEEKPLTPEYLEDLYATLVAFYYGPEVVLDPLIRVEWARIPHFYYNFYVYQYATGISAALFLAPKILAGDQQAVGNYLRFLSTGSSEPPLDLLKIAGVDLTTPEPVLGALNYFNTLIDRLESLL